MMRWRSSIVAALAVILAFSTAAAVSPAPPAVAQEGPPTPAAAFRQTRDALHSLPGEVGLLVLRDGEQRAAIGADAPLAVARSIVLTAYQNCITSIELLSIEDIERLLRWLLRR
jgi:hypothetical protein